MILNVSSYEAQNYRYVLTLSDDDERDEVKSAVWEHLNSPKWYNGNLGAPDSQKNRDILDAIADMHNVTIRYEEPIPMTKVLKQRSKAKKAS